MPLTSLHLEGCCEIKDLTPLQGMKLTTLNLVYCRGCSGLDAAAGDAAHVAGRSGLCGTRPVALARDDPDGDRVRPQSITQGMNVLRSMTTLKSISVGAERRERLTPEDFWKRYDAGEFKK